MDMVADTPVVYVVPVASPDVAHHVTEVMVVAATAANGPPTVGLRPSVLQFDSTRISNEALVRGMHAIGPLNLFYDFLHHRQQHVLADPTATTAQMVDDWRPLGAIVEVSGQSKVSLVAGYEPQGLTTLEKSVFVEWAAILDNPPPGQTQLVV